MNTLTDWSNFDILASESCTSIKNWLVDMARPLENWADQPFGQVAEALYDMASDNGMLETWAADDYTYEEIIDSCKSAARYIEEHAD